MSPYLIFFNPKLAIGHRFSCKKLRPTSHSGYFDPNDYYYNRFFVTFYKERDRSYLFSDTFVGQQACRWSMTSFETRPLQDRTLAKKNS